MEDITHPFRAQACEPLGSGSNMLEPLPWMEPVHKGKWGPHRSRGRGAEFICEILWPVMSKRSEQALDKVPCDWEIRQPADLCVPRRVWCLQAPHTSTPPPGSFRADTAHPEMPSQ